MPSSIKIVNPWHGSTVTLIMEISPQSPPLLLRIIAVVDFDQLMPAFNIGQPRQSERHNENCWR